jgi:hypothetical protein
VRPRSSRRRRRVWANSSASGDFTGISYPTGGVSWSARFGVSCVWAMGAHAPFFQRDERAYGALRLPPRSRGRFRPRRATGGRGSFRPRIGRRICRGRRRRNRCRVREVPMRICC